MIKEQVPLKGDMQNEIALYVEQRLDKCDFSKFVEEGFVIEKDKLGQK